ncbi:hypothetical protein THAOC_35792, partial [Thalassiosira oceanica]
MGAVIGPPGEAMEELDSPYRHCAGRADRARQGAVVAIQYRQENEPKGETNFGPFLYLALLLTTISYFEGVGEVLRYARDLA